MSKNTGNWQAGHRVREELGGKLERKGELPTKLGPFFAQVPYSPSVVFCGKKEDQDSGPFVTSWDLSV